VISLYFYRKSVQRKQIIYALKVEDVLFRKADLPKELEITYGGKQIAVLTKIMLFMWNGGNQPILAADLQTGEKLRVVWPEEFELFQPTVRYQSRTANKVEVNQSDLSFAYLNARDGAVVEFIGTRNSDQPLQAGQSYGTLVGEIVGAENQPKCEDYAFSVKRSYLPMVIFGFGFPAVMGWRLFSDWDDLIYNFMWWYVPLSIGGFLLALFFVLFGIVGLRIWISGNRVPVKVAAMSNEPLTAREKLYLYLG
jgi:hypothetical protein